VGLRNRQVMGTDHREWKKILLVVKVHHNRLQHLRRKRRKKDADDDEDKKAEKLMKIMKKKSITSARYGIQT
jgi:hypothetical protein